MFHSSVSALAALPPAALPGDVPGLHILSQGFFRIKFYTEGEHAVPNTDVNKNGIPDFVEDVGRQLHVAHHVFCTLSGFRSPLQSPRYPRLAYVDVNIRSRVSMRKANGIAYDEAQSARDPSSPGARAIVITVAADITPPKNHTPTHEYFHQIQNGMTHFKNRWFYEGTARWSEDALGNRPFVAADQTVLGGDLSDSAGQNKLLGMSYDAAKAFWIPLANLCPAASIALPENDPVLDLKYSDGSPVMKDRVFTGAAMMKAALEEMAAIEKVPFDTYCYGKWTEDNQRNEKNNRYILEAVQRAMKRLCPQAGS
jgi:hypothetical protein